MNAQHTGMTLASTSPLRTQEECAAACENFFCGAVPPLEPMPQLSSFSMGSPSNDFPDAFDEALPHIHVTKEPMFGTEVSAEQPGRRADEATSQAAHVTDGCALRETRCVKKRARQHVFGAEVRAEPSRRRTVAGRKSV